MRSRFVQARHRRPVRRAAVWPAAELLVRRGATVTLSDSRDDIDEADRLRRPA